MKKIFVLLILGSGCSLFGIRTTEQISYKVIKRDGDKEIRLYDSYIIAKTVVKGTYKQAQSEAFRRLAGYIFGKNDKNKKMSMTSPVVFGPNKSEEKISMTAPVIHNVTENGLEMAFKMPSVFSLNELPRPDDSRITFEEIPSHIVATIRYSWVSSERSNQEKAQELRKWLEAQNDYEIVSIPKFAGYDPPWTLPFLRRNEVLVEIRKKN
jgi:hypothetical protein